MDKCPGNHFCQVRTTVGSLVSFTFLFHTLGHFRISVKNVLKAPERINSAQILILTENQRIPETEHNRLDSSLMRKRQFKYTVSK